MRRFGSTLPRPRRARGSSLIEVLIAMTIMALLMLGILEMYSLSLVVNAGSAARTQMTFKAQQVVENIRLVYAGYRASALQGYAYAPPAGCGVPLPTLGGGAPPNADFRLPDNASDPRSDVWTFWGPDGANVMEQDNGPYLVRFNIQSGAEGAIVTVTVEPTDQTVGGVRRYFGKGLTKKRIDYVARILTSAI